MPSWISSRGRTRALRLHHESPREVGPSSVTARALAPWLVALSLGALPACSKSESKSEAGVGAKPGASSAAKAGSEPSTTLEPGTASKQAKAQAQATAAASTGLGLGTTKSHDDDPPPPSNAPIPAPTASPTGSPIGSPTVSAAVSVAPAGDASPRLLELGERAEIDKVLARFTVDYTQTFRLHLNGFGECTFASTTYKDNNVGDYIVVADGKTYPLPQHPDAKSWARHAVLGVWFGKLDRDELLDVIAIAEHMTGAGPQGARPFPVVTYYYASGPKSFRLDEGLSKKATDKGLRSLASAKQLATDGR